MKMPRCRSCRRSPRIHRDHWLCAGCFRAEFRYESAGHDHVIAWLDLGRLMLGDEWRPYLREGRVARLIAKSERVGFVWTRLCQICGRERSKYRAWKCDDCKTKIEGVARYAAHSLGVSFYGTEIALLAAKAAQIKLARLIKDAA